MLDFFRVTSLHLSSGDIVQPGNWGGVIQGAGIRHNLYFREALFEDVRQRLRPEAPSRLRSVFGFESRGAADHYIQQESRQSPVPLRVYAMRCESEPVTHLGSMAVFDKLNTTFDVAEALRAIEEYWFGSGGDDYREVLFEVPSFVVRQEN